MARIDRFMLRPVSAAARAGKIALEVETERAIDTVLSGPLPEALARSLVEHHVAERVVEELLNDSSGSDAGLDELLARIVRSDEAGRLTEEVTQRIVRSPAFRATMMELLTSPEVRRGLAEGASGFGGDLAGLLRRRTSASDDATQGTIRRLVHLPAAPTSSRFGGGIARAIALVVDAAIAQISFLVGAASVGLVLYLVRADTSRGVLSAVAGAAWLLLVTFYFAGFWSTTGQTPGLRLLGLRVVTRDGTIPSLPRALVRLAGLLLSISILFLGFVPVFVDSRRRALQDFLAGTVVESAAP